MNPKILLLTGAQKLDSLLVPQGFEFRLGANGKGSGGNFARAEFIRGERRLELHFRQSLGLVRYHAGSQSAFHETYMRELGVWNRCRYPGFSDDPLEAFTELSHDLSLADDFVVGTAAVLQRAAVKENADEVSRNQDLSAGYAGDENKLEALRSHFRGKQYAEVLKTARDLKYPSRMAATDRTKVEIARKRMKI